MATLSLTHDNIRCLNKLENLVRKEHGVRFTLSEESSLLKLLSLAAESYNNAVQQAFEHFLNSLNDSEKQKLIYRGVEIKGELALTNAVQSYEGKKVYRGRTVVSDNQPLVEDKSPEKTGSKKVYRGRVID